MSTIKERDGNTLLFSFGWGILILSFLMMRYDFDIPPAFILGIAIFTAIYTYADYHYLTWSNIGVDHKYFNTRSIASIGKKFLLAISLPVTVAIIFLIEKRNIPEGETALVSNSITLFALGFMLLTIAEKNKDTN